MARRATLHTQLDLFAAQTPPVPPMGVASAPVPAALATLAQRLPAQVYLGTSSWAFPGWHGLIYDREVSQSVLARHGLAAYAQHPLLRTVGIDRTFYAPLTAADFATYAAAVPDAFRFLVKAHAACTQSVLRSPGAATSGTLNTRFLDAGYATDQVVGPYTEGLGDKAGVLLFQFSPQDVRALGGAQAFATRLYTFLDALPRGPRYAVELRNTALLTPAYREALVACDACHCFNVHPSMPTLPDQQRVLALADSPALLIRWMLHPTLHYEAATARYKPFDRLVDADPSTRRTIATMCLEAAQTGRAAFVIANNKAEGSSPQTLFHLAACIVADL